MKHNKEYLYKLRFIQKKRTREIASILGVSTQRVSQILIKYFGSSGSVIPKRVFVCLECKKRCERYFSKYKGKKEFCSKECKIKYNSIRCSKCQKVAEKIYKNNGICRECNSKRIKEYYYTPSGNANIKKAIKKTTKKHWNKQIARLKVRAAILKGILKRPQKCEKCNKKGIIQGHHKDYTKPLKVEWLCIRCHRQADLEMV